MLAALALCSGLFTTLDLGDRTELRLRATTGPVFAVDLTTVPYVRLESKNRHVLIKAGYAAMVTQADLEAGFPAGPQLFQLADVSTWYSARHWVVGVSQAGAYGDMNFSYLTPFPITPGQPGSTGPPPTTLIPCVDAARCASETLHFGTSATGGLVRWSHRETTIAIAPSYAVGGGTDAASQAIIPIVSTPRLDFAVEYRATRRDVIITEGDATAADSTPRACDPNTGGPPPISDPNRPRIDPPSPGLAGVAMCSPREQWAGLRETWRRRISRRAGIELSAGATVARATINSTDEALNPSRPYQVVTYPTLRALVGYSFQNTDLDRPMLHPVLTDPPRPSIYVSARLGPVVDTHYGFIDPRLEISAGALKPLGPSYTLGAHAAFVRSIPPTTLDATYVAGWAELLRRIDKFRFEAGGGFRAAYQHDPFAGEFFVISFYATIVWHEPQIKL